MRTRGRAVALQQRLWQPRGDAQFRASDDFVLTGAQEDLIWQRMGRGYPNDDDGAPCGCKPTLFDRCLPRWRCTCCLAAVTARDPDAANPTGTRSWASWLLIVESR